VHVLDLTAVVHRGRRGRVCEGFDEVFHGETVTRP
jgi:hypothetical protein